MRNYAIYSIISLAIIIDILLAISGQIVPTLFAVALAACLYASGKTSRGRRWWRTWYRVGMEFDMMLRPKRD